MDSVILAVEVTCRLREVLAAHARKEPLLCGMVASVRVAQLEWLPRKQVL